VNAFLVEQSIFFTFLANEQTQQILVACSHLNSALKASANAEQHSL